MSHEISCNGINVGLLANTQLSAGLKPARRWTERGTWYCNALICVAVNACGTSVAGIKDLKMFMAKRCVAGSLRSADRLVARRLEKRKCAVNRALALAPSTMIASV